MTATEEPLPEIKLNRKQWLRLIVVGFFAALVVARVAPDAVRVVQPLGIFNYATDADGVVIRAQPLKTKGSDVIKIGDRVRLDRIKPFDRKPGLIGNGYTRENFNRHLPIERNGKERLLTLNAQPESVASRIITMFRIFMFVVSVALGAILFLIKPSIATAGFLAFCLGGDYPTTFVGAFLDVPYREVTQWIGDTIWGAARPGLLLFALCLFVEHERMQRVLASTCAVLALMLGTLNAYRFWLSTYAAHPALRVDHAYGAISTALTVITTMAFVAALARARGAERRRTEYIAASFGLAAIARLLSDQLFPAHISYLVNVALLSVSVIPIVVVWVAVVRHGFFEVDFVVSRAIVYVAITATVIGIISISEEALTYVFYNNTDLAYGIIIAISMGIGALTGKIKHFLDGFVDRFIFPGRRAQRKALEQIAAQIIDAQTVEEVHKMLLIDSAEALELEFSGILARTESGSYELAQRHNWPDDCKIRLAANDALTRELTRSRSVLTFTGHETALVRAAFPNDRLTFAAPLFVDRTVTEIVVYGHNVSGLGLDPDERQLLVRVVAHASIALNMIELSKYRAGGARAALAL